MPEFQKAKANLTIKSLDSKVGGPWTNKKGVPQNFLTGLFTDGRAFSAMIPVAEIDAAKAVFNELIGKPGDFEYSDRTDNQGNKVMSIWTWPGAPERKFGGGGGKTYTVAFNNTREGCMYTTASIQAQVALKCAVDCWQGVQGWSEESVMKTAQLFLGFLSAHTPAPAEPAKPAEIPSALAGAPTGPTDREKAQQFVKAKIEAFEGCMTAQGFQLLSENAEPLRKRLKEKNFLDLLGEMDAASTRCEARFDTGSDTIPF